MDEVTKYTGIDTVSCTRGIGAAGMKLGNAPIVPQFGVYCSLYKADGNALLEVAGLDVHGMSAKRPEAAGTSREVPGADLAAEAHFGGRGTCILTEATTGIRWLTCKPGGK